ncbi:uncharacterized protein MELLADRAFT_88969 [Melampsora larici-populina 98AG31]|uniref:Uncharacterized protein n=1 Tax=Melampsora larici-populina (strain 98AG31 / pathotype 3-4-7) TaxID=747676 RepID=F4R6G7_MELLP|nr:uncharacterized protein MELLADRAFT_88969 [Melampsora larici-populina 98AG31]EGG11878.1 hypothetical protein MELLADRAFT_88969 [Melampsora larici-populina 98AG31]
MATPDLTATINAILTTTSDTTLLRAILADGGVAWHKTDAVLILNGVGGQHVTWPLKAFGYLMANDVLTWDWTYNIHGDFGQDSESGNAFIKHSSLTQSLVATVAPQPQELAGKAMISGIGKVVKVNIDLTKEDDGVWHLTVHAEHEVFDPEKQFEIIYRFGNFSPELSEMKDIQLDSLMYFQGTVHSKDEESKHIIVQVLHHTVVLV